MDEEKHNVEPGILGTEGRTYYGRGAVRAVEGNREPIEYSYRLVYTQESIRVLDMRIVADAGVNIGHLQQLLGAIERAITIGAIINDEYSPPELRERLREGLND